MDILSIVVKPTWREFLVELITSNQMDPWDVDITAVADAYLAKIRELAALDLRVPANVILASALLLHFKAESLKLDEFGKDDAVVEEEIAPLVEEDVPELVFRPNIPKNRRVTLDELMNAVEQVMAAGKVKPRIRASPQDLDVEIPKEDMHEMMARFYERVSKERDGEGIVLFSSLLETRSIEEVVRNISPLLHLVQEDKLAAWQDEVFGEIFIKCVEPAVAVELVATTAPAPAG